jgi:DNA-directed RNA polymerase specialized sigma24 family protein
VFDNLNDLYQAWRGDESHLDSLLSSVTDKSRWIASRVDRRITEEDAQDIAQEVTVSIWKRIDQGEIDSLIALVTTYTLNRVRDWQRTSSPRSLNDAETSGEDADESISQNQSAMTQPSSLSPGTYTRIIQAVDGTLTLKEINGLISGYTVEEIALESGEEPHFLRNKIARLRSKLTK